MVQYTHRNGFRRPGGFALLALIVLTASPSPARAAMRVVESDSRHVLVEVRPDGLATEPLSGPNGDYVRIRMADGGMTEEAGRPEVPRASFQVAVPPGAQPRLRVVREQWSGSRPGAITPLPVRVGVRDPFGPDQVVEEQPVEGPEYTLQPRYPAAPFALSEIRDVRGLRTVNVIWHGVIAETAARTHQVLESALLEVTFQADPLRAPTPTPTTRPAPPDELWDRTRQWPLLNGAQARGWVRGTPADGPSVGDVPWGGGTQVKVRIDRTGLVRLRYADLAAAGFPSGVPVGEVAVYQRSFAMGSVDDPAVPAADLFAPIDVPVLVRDDGNGTFDGNDHVLLYGRSFRDQWMTSGWEHEDKFQTDNFYWVRHRPAGGARMSPRGAQLPSPAADSLTSTQASFFREDDDRYLDRPPDFGPGSQAFEAEFAFRNNAATLTGFDIGWNFTDTFQAVDPVPGTADTLVARVLPGGRTVYGSFSNILDFTVNGSAVGQSTFFNSSLYDGTGVVPPQNVLWKHVIPAGTLAGGSNTFTFRGRTYDSGGTVQAVTRFFFDWYDIRYDRQLIARNDELLVTTRNGTAADQRIRVRGFTGTDLLLLDVTVPGAPEAVAVDPSQVVAAGGGAFDLRFGHDNTGGSWAIYLAARESQVPAVPSGDLQAVSPPTLLAGGIGARWVAVAHDDFVSGVQPLAAHRSLKYSTLTVPLTQVWDVFGMGGRNPDALKAYAAYAYHRWSDPIAFLLLVGDASEVHRPLTSQTADPDFLPSHSLWTQYEGAAEESDQYYAEVTRSALGQPWDDLADLYVGRLPVGDLGELAWNVTRIVNYETEDPDGLWRRQAVLLADDAISGSLGGGFGNPYGFNSNERRFCESTEDYADSLLAHRYDVLQPQVMCMSQWSHPCEWECYDCPNPIRFCGDVGRCDSDTIDCETRLGVNCGNWYRCRTPDSCTDTEWLGENQCARERMLATGHVALRDRLNAGVLLWNFEGHAHRWFLTHEEIWYDGAGVAAARHDAQLLKNWGKPFLFLGFACHLAEFDRFDERGEDCLSEKMMNARQLGAPADQPGGAIAVFASSGFEFLDPNLRFNQDVIDAFYFPERATDPGRLDGGGSTLPPVGDGATYRWTLGESTTRARLMFQNRYSPQGQTRQAAQRFVLLGDPALEPNVGAPGLQVTVNGLPVQDPAQVFSLNPAESPQVDVVVTASDGRGVAGWRVLDAGVVVDPAQYEVTDPSGGADITPDGVPLRQTLAYSFAPRQGDEEYTVSLAALDGSGTESRFDLRITRTFQFDVSGGEPAVFPSPFQDETWFVYRTTQDVDHITVDVYSISGRRIRELHDGSLPANVQLKLRWDGRDGNGSDVANGTYFIVAKASGNEQSDRRVLPVVKMR